MLGPKKFERLKLQIVLILQVPKEVKPIESLDSKYMG